MKKLKRAYKIEINPTDDQKSKIHQTIGVSRFIYNFYIAHNKEVYEKEGKFVNGMDFSKCYSKYGQIYPYRDYSFFIEPRLA